MEASKQNMNQYFLHHQTNASYPPIMNNPINFPQFIQPFCLPNYYTGYPYGPPQQMIYHPSTFIAPQPTHLIEQNANFLSETTSQTDIEKLLLETIPDLDGSEGSFEIKKFFKKFDAYLQDWSEKKKIFALKSKLYGKAKSFFILAIKAKHYNYKSIKNFILCQLLPSEYKVEESIDLVKNRTNSSQQKKNLKTPEKSHKPKKIPTPSFINKVNIQFEKEEISKEILEFFEMPIKQDSAKEEIEIEILKKGKFSKNLVPMVEKEFNFELLENFGKEQFCEINEEIICSLDGKQDFVSVEFPIPAESYVFHEIASENIPISDEENKQVEIVSSESEKCFDLGNVVEEFVDLKEFGKEECDLKEKGSDLGADLKELEDFNLKEILEEKDDEKGILESKLDVFEKDPEKEILPSRDKLKILEENKNIVEKRKLLRFKLRNAKILAKLRCEVLRKEILRNDFGFGFMKRKIMGRFFLEVRRCLNFEKLVTVIRVPNLSKNFLKEMNRINFDLKPKKVLYFVSATKQDVIRQSKSAKIEKDWKKRKRKQEIGLVESVSVTEFLTIGVQMETFHRRSGSLNRVGLENPMITLTLTSPKSKERTTSPPKTFRETGRDGRTYSDVEDAVI